jgi:hypothetical protein
MKGWHRVQLKYVYSTLKMGFFFKICIAMNIEIESSKTSSILKYSFKRTLLFDVS